MGTFPVTLMVSLSVAVVLLIIRVAVMQRVQNQRQRENRQDTERLKSLAAAYRALAGSFTPAEAGDRRQLEEALSDIILFGDRPLVELGAKAANELVRTGTADLGPLIEELRVDLRAQLGLEPYPDGLVIPASGPGRPNRGGDDRGGRRGSGAGGGGGRGGGGGGGGAGLGGAAIGGAGGHALSEADDSEGRG